MFESCNVVFPRYISEHPGISTINHFSFFSLSAVFHPIKLKNLFLNFPYLLVCNPRQWHPCFNVLSSHPSRHLLYTMEYAYGWGRCVCVCVGGGGGGGFLDSAEFLYFAGIYFRGDIILRDEIKVSFPNQLFTDTENKFSENQIL